MRDTFVGVDVGTNSARVCVIDSNGRLLDYAVRDICRWTSAKGMFEQATSDIWESICDCLNTIISSKRVNVESIRGIGFAATCSLTAFTCDTLEPVSLTPPTFDHDDHNVILWLDERGQEEAQIINDTQDEVLQYLGGSISREMHLAKVMWLKRNMPTEKFEKCVFFDLSDALDHVATGRWRRDCGPYCDRTCTPVGLDGTVKGWQPEFLSKVGLEGLTRDIFCQIGGVCKHGRACPPGTRAGLLSTKAAKQLGIPAGIPVSCGVIDAFAGWVGTISSKIPDLKETIDLGVHNRIALVAGTSTCMMALSKKPSFVSGIWGPYQDWMLPGYWMGEGGQIATGHLLQHTLQSHPAYKTVESLVGSQEKSIFAWLDDFLHDLQKKYSAPSITHLGRHLFFYGDLFGNRSPIADSTMAGSVCGLRADNSLENLALLYYATLEFLALQARQIISAMNESGYEIRTIFMSGSQCQNEIFVNLLATCCNMPVILSPHPQAAVAIGSAMLAATASSHYEPHRDPSLLSEMSRLSTVGQVIVPNRNEYLVKLLDVKYKVFLEMCERQRVFRKMVDDVTITSPVASV